MKSERELDPQTPPTPPGSTNPQALTLSNPTSGSVQITPPVSGHTLHAWNLVGSTTNWQSLLQNKLAVAIQNYADLNAVMSVMWQDGTAPNGNLIYAGDFDLQDGETLAVFAKDTNPQGIEGNSAIKLWMKENGVLSQVFPTANVPFVADDGLEHVQVGDPTFGSQNMQVPISEPGSGYEMTVWGQQLNWGAYSAIAKNWAPIVAEMVPWLLMGQAGPSFETLAKLPSRNDYSGGFVNEPSFTIYFGLCVLVKEIGEDPLHQVVFRIYRVYSNNQSDLIFQSAV